MNHPGAIKLNKTASATEVVAAIGPGCSLPGYWRPLADKLPEHTELFAAVMPGRASRLTEPVLRSISAMAADAASWMSMIHTDLDLRIVGVCSGTPVALLAAYILGTAGRRLDVHLVNPTSDLEMRSAPLHRLDAAQFALRLSERGIVPPELIADEEAFKLFEPMLRGDLEAIETFDGADFQVNATRTDVTIYRSPDTSNILPRWIGELAGAISQVSLCASSEVVAHDPATGFADQLTFAH